jgi:hypothetical protein
MTGPSFQLLFHILQSEQAVLARTDQKAYTLLSVLGVFMTFFIVYFRLLIMNAFIVAILPIYFGAAFLTIWQLVHTILPRFHRDPKSDDEGEIRLDPTFFGGIREFSTSKEYFDHLRGMDLDNDEERVLQLLSRQVHALAIINWSKNTRLRRGVYGFVVAIGVELVMVLSTFITKGLEALAS